MELKPVSFVWLGKCIRAAILVIKDFTLQGVVQQPLNAMPATGTAPNGERSTMQLTDREIGIMNEAFMVGREYASTGEKESPAEISKKCLRQCKKVAALYDAHKNGTSPNNSDPVDKASMQICPVCQGNGDGYYKPGTLEVIPCGKCKGSGQTSTSH